MIVVAVWLLFAAGCWWVWQKSDPQRPAARTVGGTAATASSADGARIARTGTPQPRTPLPGRARPPRFDGPPLSEDDVIAFGLALEGAEDVVGRAVADGGRGPAEPRVRRDVAGPS